MDKFCVPYFAIDFRGMVGREVSLETHDGMYRTGILTGVRHRVVSMDGANHNLPIALVIGDDEIPFERIRVLNKT